VASPKGEANAQAGEGAGSYGHRETIKQTELKLRCRHGFSDHGRYRLSVPNSHGLKTHSQETVLFAIEDCSRTGGKCGINRQDFH
jgi:hypothetical protein